MKKLVFYILFFAAHICFAQNCKFYKTNGQETKFKACQKYKQAKKHYQFLAAHHKLLDEVIAIDPTFDDAYWSKSIAYLKSGDFLSWKPIIDKAVELAPKNHLGYRGWCRYQFFRDYKGAIEDIEAFEKIIKGDIGVCQNGDYHLLIAKALCYKGIGQTDKAIAIIQDYLNRYNQESDLFNFYHLGVLYFEKGDTQKAMQHFLRQKQANHLAENQYYIALCKKKLQQAFKQDAQKAKQMYEDGYVMHDPYTHQMDKVFKSQIIELIGD